jgi:hypothetical protein
LKKDISSRRILVSYKILLSHKSFSLHKPLFHLVTPSNASKMNFFLLFSVLTGLLSSACHAIHHPSWLQESLTIPPTAVTGDVTANFQAVSSLDGPQLSAINGTSWDWWYFDAVSPDAKSNVAIIFYTASSLGFPFLPPSPEVTLVEVHALLPNGTIFNVFIPAEEAVITPIGDGSLGCFEGANASWTGSSDMKDYRVVIDSAANGVVGTFVST